MKTTASFWMGSTALLLAGCVSTSAPLVFGDTTTFGVRLGNDGSTGGGSVSIGLKAQSVAIVPVTYLDENGWIQYLNGFGRESGDRDGMSVFASFDSGTPKIDASSKAVVHLGQVFSTGLAAQQVTLGYVCRDDKIECDRLKAKLKQERPPTTKPSTERFAAKSKEDGATEKRRPYQAPLFFARTDVVGIDIGGSLAQEGIQFVLGYSNRNLALIPTVAQSANGKVLPIMGSDKDGDGERAFDAFSVMGQFRADTSTTNLGYGLERYFATGMAARNLGISVGKVIADSPSPGKRDQPPDKPGGSVTAMTEPSR